MQKKKKKWAFSEAGGRNVKVIWIQRQLNAGPSGALMEPAWVPLLERVLYIFIMSQHILIPIWTLQPHVMGLDSYNPLGILLQQNMPASSSMCFILFTSVSSHTFVISCHSLQQLSEEHGVGTIVLISQMKAQKNKTHTLSLWIDGASTHMVQTCCSCCWRGEKSEMCSGSKSLCPSRYKHLSVWSQGSLYWCPVELPERLIFSNTNIWAPSRDSDSVGLE